MFGGSLASVIFVIFVVQGRSLGLIKGEEWALNNRSDSVCLYVCQDSGYTLRIVCGCMRSSLTFGLCSQYLTEDLVFAYLAFLAQHLYNSCNGTVERWL